MAALDYYPSHQHAAQFWETQRGREEAEDTEPCVPEGFPKQLHSSLAWTRAEIEGQCSKWTVELNNDDIRAIETALSSFEGIHKG